MNQKKSYEAPSIWTYSTAEILAKLGPAKAIYGNNHD
jgi:hypothetical protein